MKNPFRNGIALLLAIVLLAGIPACSSAQDSDRNAASATPEMGKPEPQPEAPKKPLIIGDEVTDPSSNPPADIGGYEETPDVWEGPATVWLSAYDKSATHRPISAVKWWQDKEADCYYLFLPSSFAKGDLQLWFQGDAACSIDAVAYTNGAAVKSLADGDHILELGGTSYTVKVMRSAKIGAMYINTESGSMDYIHKVKGNKESGQMLMEDANGKILYNDALSEIKGRGNATWKRAKKGYQIKLDQKTALVGNAGKAKTWILLANYLERTLFRNTLAYDLAYQAGLTESSLSTYVDLYCNGEYRGTYQLTEKVQINENRVDIQDLEKATEAVNDQALDSYPTFGPAGGKKAGNRKGYKIPNDPADITGGYLLELDYADRYKEEPSGFVTDRGQAVVIKEPECASRAQVDYIANYFQEFEDACFAEDGKCPSTGKYYYEYFDLTSLARKYIVEEITKNIDTDVTSQFFYKPSDKESKVGYCGPVWDYDNAMGNYSAGDSTDGDGIYAAKRKKYITRQLYQKETFLQTVKSEWAKTFKPLLTTCATKNSSPAGSVLKTVHEYEKMLTASAAMNFTRWDNIDTVDKDAYNDTGSTYREHVDFLKSFLQERLEFLSEEWR
ncbi:MAG: CotH kinase family protein [Clostridia bacterium]|nr:CotH kinase family protein [Clostridia bacterium]